MPRLARGEGADLLDRFRRYLQDHRQPRTRQRDLVAELIFLAEDHLSVEEVGRRLKERGEAVGTATLYRTLDLLVESGLVRANDFGEGFRRYEPVVAQAHHEHLICERCGRVEEFANERLERMLPVIADEHGFEHRRHRVEVYGVCRACRGRELRPLAARGAP
ncbi:MAG: transcriptional repressor [Gemmatimonadales bacterium]|nr:transcriptional repressor [Gemmatimonadales bacterium]